MARIEKKDAVMVQLGGAQAGAVLLALDEARQHVMLRIARMPAAVGHQLTQAGGELRNAAVRPLAKEKMWAARIPQ